MKNALITPAQARAARHSLVLSLKQLSEATKINRSYVSMFENGKMPLAQKYQQALVDYFLSRDVDLDALANADPGGTQRAVRIVQGLVRQRCFYLSNELPQSQYERAIEQMEAHDERIAELLNTAISRGVFSDLDAEAEADQRELFGLLAANYLLFRLLQGHNIISPRPEGVDAKTQADLLADWFGLTLDEVAGTTAPVPAEAADADAAAGENRSTLL